MGGWVGWVVGELRNKTKLQPSSVWLELELSLAIDEIKQLEDSNKDDTEITMDIVQNLANSINPMIKLTVETPSNHPDGKLPVLDITVRINLEAHNRLDFELYLSIYSYFIV